MPEGSNRARAIPGMFVEAFCMAWNDLMAQIFHIGPTFGFSPYCQGYSLVLTGHQRFSDGWWSWWRSGKNGAL